MNKTARVYTEKNRSGFTLVELLVVIAIIAILAAVVVLIINPLELTRRGRDSTRLADLANLQQVINIAVQEATASGTNIACNGAGTTCVDRTFPVGASTRLTNGNGWVRINLGVQTSVPVPTLPIDPTNDATRHYVYCGSGDNWQIIADLESVQQQPKRGTDGGSDPLKYEVGSVLNLFGSGTCTY